MLQDLWYIRHIDHRISSAVIFFLLLIVLGERKNRKLLFGLRLTVSLVAMALVSWSVRFIIDTCLVGVVSQGVGYSTHLLTMSLLYWGCYMLCYEVENAEVAYVDLLALTIYKMAWNAFKFGAAVTSMLDNSYTPWGQYSFAGSLVSYLTYFAVCLIACKIHRMIVKGIPTGASEKSMLIGLGAFLFCQLILEFCGHVLTADNATLLLYHLCALLYAVMNYVVLIFIMQLSYYRRDNEDMHTFIKNKMQYYEMSRDGITSLQIKCHDLKHQIAMIRSKVGKDSFEKHIARLEDSIIEYGTVVECGNEALNLILTEKNILCATNGVKFSYIIDGALYDFLTEMEVYSVFGNALDNALESASRVSDPEKRMISLKAVSRGEMVVLHVENYFEHKPNLVNGMPVTTKKGHGHGFGLRSIQQIAEKYQGAASVQVDEPFFKLTVIMRKPSAA